MSFDPKLLQLYAVTDRQWTGRQTLIQQLEAVIQVGVTLVKKKKKDKNEKKKKTCLLYMKICHFPATKYKLSSFK